MIKTENLVPHVYYKESRDFQLFGRLYDSIFNYIKTNVDLMENFPINNNTDSKLIELLCRTLGFENKTNYRVDDLNAICCIFISLIKNKGTKKAIEELAKTILNIEGVKNKISIVDNDIKLLGSKKVNIRHLDINVPEISSNSELKLFEDILDYIIPAGVTYTLHDSMTSDNNQGYIYINNEYRVDKINPNNKYNSNQINKDDDEQIQTSKLLASKDTINLSVKLGDMRYSVIDGANTDDDKEEE